MRLLRRRGFVNTTIHVMYEVLSPFLIFLAAEELHVSGILAVVAAGLIMQEHSLHMMSAETARHHLVANSFWEVIVFLINGIIFVMLGMQLPRVMQPQDMEGIHPAIVLTATLAVTATIILMRFLWISAMELRHKDPETGLRGKTDISRTLKQALVTTIAGPKGAVTLSIILTIPLTVNSGRVFPFRSLIIFLTSGVILCTLLLADFVLPRLSPKEVNEDEEHQLQQARLMVLEGVVDELRRALDENADAEFVPAGRLALMRYRTRLMHQRFTMEEHGDTLKQVMRGVLSAQQKRADEIQSGVYDVSAMERMPYYSILPGIRASIGYVGDALNVGSRFETRRGRLFFRLFRHRQSDFEEEKMARVYYDTCLFAIDLEHAAMDYLHTVEKEDDPDRVRAAQLLLQEHEASLQSLWGRINYGQETPLEDTGEYDHGFHEGMPEGLSANTAGQFRMARQYADEVDSYALSMELEQIQKLREEGTISESVSRELREQVYLMQTAFI